MWSLRIPSCGSLISTCVTWTYVIPHSFCHLYAISIKLKTQFRRIDTSGLHYILKIMCLLLSHYWCRFMKTCMCSMHFGISQSSAAKISLVLFIEVYSEHILGKKLLWNCCLLFWLLSWTDMQYILPLSNQCADGLLAMSNITLIVSVLAINLFLDYFVTYF